MATYLNVQQAIANAYIIKSHNPTYSMENRGLGLNASQYDCSSFIASCWGLSSAPPTNSMESQYQNRYGFKRLDYTQTNLLRGDILVWYYLPSGAADPQNGNAHGHTAMYLGNNRLIECAYSYNGIVEGRTPSGIHSYVPYGHCVLRGSPSIGIGKWIPSDTLSIGWKQRGFTE